MKEAILASTKAQEAAVVASKEFPFDAAIDSVSKSKDEAVKTKEKASKELDKARGKKVELEAEGVNLGGVIEKEPSNTSI